MKLIIKNLKQVPHEVEVGDDTCSVRDLKLAIEQAHSLDANSLKLLFNGVVLVDTKKLVEYNIKEGNVIIMMATKAKPANVQAEEPKKEEKAQPQPTTTTTVTEPKETKPTTSTIPAVAQRDYSAEVQTLLDMGFPKPESEAAIKAARGQVDLAIEFLYNGIPEGLPQEQPVGVVGERGASSSPELVKIASIIKILCANNPAILQNILLKIQQTDPQLMELIQANQEEFRNLIQQPITEEDMTNFRNFQNQVEGGPGAEERQPGTGSGTSQPRGQPITLSKEDYEAVKRLKELGFNELEAVQAYFACEKNEDMAANFLWETKLRDQEQELFIDYSQIGGAQTGQQGGQQSGQQAGQQQGTEQPVQRRGSEPSLEQSKPSEKKDENKGEPGNSGNNP